MLSPFLASVAIGLVGPLSPLATVARAQPRIIIEAEDLPPAGNWHARPWESGYFCASFANDFASRQAFLAAPPDDGGSTAQTTITVTEPGVYALFARYACPFMYNARFTVRLVQGGATVLQHAFGRLQAPKIWPFGGGIQPMAAYPWGGGDNIVWEQAAGEARLQEGEVTLTLIADEQPEPAAERQVDVFLLTPLDEEVQRRLKSWSYLPLDGLLTQAGDLYLRITNPGDGKAPWVVTLTTIEHSPYWVHGRNWQTPLLVGARGVITGPPADQDFIVPGQASPWVEIGSRLDRLNESTLVATLMYQGEAMPGIHATFDFAVPDTAGDLSPIRSVTSMDPAAKAVRFAVPGNVRGETTIRTAEEELEAILQYLRALPKRGKTPEHVGIRGVFDSHYVAAGASQRLDELAAALQRELVGDALHRGIQVTSLGDEIGLSLAKKTPESDQAFRDALRVQGLKPEDLLPAAVVADARAKGVADLWSFVELDYEGRETNPRIWYHSQIFGYEHGSMLELKKQTERITVESGGKMRTGANYSPHPQYWPREYQWVRPFKLGALTMPWSEDYVWGIPEVSPQVTGYLLDVFRCAAKYHDLPICYYVMPHSPGNTPRDFRLSYYAALAHGATLLDHFCVTPIVTAYTENYVYSRALPMYREIHDLARELGQFDDILAAGKVRPARVALLISGTTDLWDPSPNYNHERKCLYYALRHAGTAVDFLTEDDIVEGRLRDYAVLYISASHMLRAAAQALTAWVQQGGIVCSVAGGGLLNEYHEPNAVMLALLGLESANLQEHDVLGDTKHTLPRLRPADGLRLELPGQARVALPALGTTQRLVPLEGTEVVGWLHDNTPGATLRRFGQGAALMIGGFPGAAYVVPAIPVRPWDRGTTDAAMCHFLPTAFDTSAADVILWPVRQAKVSPDIQLSAPIVEWSAVDAGDSTAILLINWTGRPIQALTVSVRGPLNGRRVRSIQHGPLEPLTTADGWQVTLPLDTTDCITLRPAG